MFYQVLLVSYLVVAILLIGFVLIQQGKGADMGASFGSGGSNTIFGSSGSGNFMTRTTAVLATCFFVISLLIGSITAGTSEAVDEFENIDVPPVEQSAPVVSDSLIPASEGSDPEAATEANDNTVPTPDPNEDDPNTDTPN